MQPDYSPEPWRIGPYWIESATNEETGADADEVCFLSAAWHSKDSANARRIVACVNACAGIPTEVLESGALQQLVAAAREIGERPGGVGVEVFVDESALLEIERFCELLPRPETDNAA